MLRVLAALLLGLGTLTFPPIVNDLLGQVDRVVEVGASRSYSGGDKVLSWRGRSVQLFLFACAAKCRSVRPRWRHARHLRVDGI